MTAALYADNAVLVNCRSTDAPVGPHWYPSAPQNIAPIVPANVDVEIPKVSCVFAVGTPAGFTLVKVSL